MSEQDQPVVDPFAVPKTTDAAPAEAETSDAAPDADVIASELSLIHISEPTRPY